MSDYTVRPITEAERRPVYDVLQRALHRNPVTDERWARITDFWAADGTTGAFAGELPVGVASSIPSTIVLPGGATLPMAAVDGVAVRSDWTRRGVLTAMMDTQLHEFAERGYPVAGLHASEAVIYGRFGYGVATRSATIRAKLPARLRDGATAPGTVHVLDGAEATATASAIHERIGLRRPGMIARPARWWEVSYSRKLDLEGYRLAVHTGPGDSGVPDGFAVFRTVPQRDHLDPNHGALLEAEDFVTADDAAVAGLWRFLLSVDLLATVNAPGRPVDEEVGVLLTDSRRARTVSVGDELWLRLVDVPAALAARTYGTADPVVLDVADRMLPDNTGRYRIGPDGVERTGAAADLALDVDTLAMLYLGEWRPATLALAGRITGADPGALSRADALFRTAQRPWCGTHFCADPRLSGLTPPAAPPAAARRTGRDSSARPAPRPGPDRRAPRAPRPGRTARPARPPRPAPPSAPPRGSPRPR
ncbi:putative acetyltransferase [Amycolatopsis jiangsuensis]|uniref:Putative acetyltransferase n=1 Tax=Amycolatopsis jiangsuensis TaxID=1181879 RepID=A0A840IQV2_9PSEU|nr:putative acetyltransferase [Amycolatopsis jiangsuensis]